TYGTRDWDRNLRAYLKNAQELRRLREKEREMALIPVKLPDGKEVRITAGGQNDRKLFAAGSPSLGGRVRQLEFRYACIVAKAT
ncbi:MAG: hypothetical protein QXZ09_05005, partial [Candidatus Methanomethylicaceae archaeon]